MGKVHLVFEVKFEDCDEEVIERTDALVQQIRNAFLQSLEQSGVQLDVQRHVVQRHVAEEGGSAKHTEIGPPVRLPSEDARWLKQMLNRAIDAMNAHTGQSKSDADRDSLLDEDMQVLRDLVAARELLEERIGGG